MKKILAIVLALCLTLSLCVVASAADTSPSVPPPSGDGATGMAGATGGYAAATAKSVVGVSVNGVTVNGATVAYVENGPVFDELAGQGVTGMLYVDLPAGITGPVTLDILAPGTTENAVVLLRDAWEVVENAGLVVLGDRVEFTIDAAVLKEYHYVAVANNYTTVDVIPPAEQADTEEDSAEGDADMTVDDTNDVEADPNPITGVALAVVPMMAAAAAIVISKKR